MSTIESPVTKKQITVGGPAYKKLLREGINPHTGRTIVVGGPKYNELMGKGKNKTSPKRKQTPKKKRSPPKEKQPLSNDLYELRKEYLAGTVTPKEIEKHLHQLWPDYDYKNKPIMNPCWVSIPPRRGREYLFSNIVQENIDELEEFVDYWTKEYPGSTDAEIDEAISAHFGGNVFHQNTDFLWIYNLKEDEFEVYSLTDEALAEARAEEKKQPWLIELYAK